ncbi:MAG: hypothetical protein V1693_03720 [Nanoarchaeota archaeon]|nr:hypothetical protein [Nanoarchaeota archaeon]
MKEFIYGGLILILVIVVSLFFIISVPETITFVTILLGSIIAAVGTYIASYRAQKYLQDRSEKKGYIKTVFYPIYRELESNLNRLKTNRRTELTTNIWIYTINSPEYLGLTKEIRTTLEKLYEKIKLYNSVLNTIGKERGTKAKKLVKDMQDVMKVLESEMKEKE